MTTVLVLAPHPDDETLGCGMTLLRHIAEGAEVHWLIMTKMTAEGGFTDDQIAERENEIKRVSEAYPFSRVHRGNFSSTRLDVIPIVELIDTISQVVKEIQPDIVYLPNRNDVHSDHAAVFDAAVACTKSFRYPSIRQICVYETLSETEFSLRPDDMGFRPNLFIDGTVWLDRKIEILRLFKTEVGDFPFPRSVECIRSQAMLRGSQAGVQAAEAFMLLKELR